MRNWITFGGGFFSSLATTFTAKQPVTSNDWIVALVVAISAGFGMLGIKGANTLIKNSELRKEAGDQE